MLLCVQILERKGLSVSDCVTEKLFCEAIKDSVAEYYSVPPLELRYELECDS